MNAKKNFRVFSCYEMDCPLASEEKGTCDDDTCLSHPSNIEKENPHGDVVRNEVQSEA